MVEPKPCKTGNYKHGYSVTHPKLFLVWETMRSRCKNPHRQKYNDYGGRGISVCKEWDEDCEAFCKWALENGYKDGLQIDRIDNDGDYCPDNCRFVTPKQNSRNRRNTVFLTVGVFTKCVSEWCELLPISQFTVYWWVKKKGKKYAEDRIAELFCDTIQDIVAWNRRADNEKGGFHKTGRGSRSDRKGVV